MWRKKRKPYLITTRVRMIYRETERQKDRQTDRETDRQTDRHTHTHTHTHTRQMRSRARWIFYTPVAGIILITFGLFVSTVSTVEMSDLTPEKSESKSVFELSSSG